MAGRAGKVQQPEGEEVPGGRSNPNDPNSPCLGILKMLGGREFQDRNLSIKMMYVPIIPAPESQRHWDEQF